MKFSHIALAASLAVASSAALANNVNNSITVTGGSTPFGALHTDSFDFTDVFTFNVTGTFFTNASLITIGFTPTQNIDFTGAVLTGTPGGPFSLSLSPAGQIETGVTLSQVVLTGPIYLTVTGKTGATGGAFSSYSGTLNVTPVPEPETYALMLAGLGVIGFVAARRKAG